MTGLDLDRLAELVADHLAGRPAPLPTIMDAGRLADYLDVSRDVIYANADMLGAIRLGDGPRPRLRFVVDADTVRRWCTFREAGPPPKPARRTRKTSVPLLPIGGES